MPTAAYYQAPIADFLLTQIRAILGELTQAHAFAGFDTVERDIGAWSDQIRILKEVLYGLGRGQILFEFVIPRMGKRADNVLVIDGVVIVLEFKVGATEFARSAIEQAHDYALDLK